VQAEIEILRADVKLVMTHTFRLGDFVPWRNYVFKRKVYMFCLYGTCGLNVGRPLPW